MPRFSALSRAIGTAAFALATFAAGLAAAAPLRGVIDAPSLHARLGQPGLVVIDIRSGETREKGVALYRAGHIPGAVHADYAHASWRLPRENTSLYLPEPAQFEALAGELGVGNDNDVVVVHDGEDDTSFGAAARVYWSFRAMGHGSIAILDGGFRAWKAAGLPVATGGVTPAPAFYEAKPVPQLRAGLDEVLEANRRKVTLIDSRPESFFTGAEKHKAARAAGHIPGAVSIPHSRAFTTENKLKDRASLEKAFAVGEGPAIAYCNTGHWAATDWFVLSEILGRPDVKLYDGSMVEYTLENRAPVSTAKPRSGS